jgi:intracellular sulfur oxidation DsrE/DsrF family protein
MSINTDRRATITGFGAAIVLAGAASHRANAAAKSEAPRAGALAKLTERLSKTPRRRDFKTVPMILESPEFWDSAALKEVIAYKAPHKQAWDNTQIAGSWLNVMRNSLNAQVFSFRHPDFLAVSATHGPAHLALYDQQIWEKYKLADMTSGAFKTNTLIVPKHASDASGNAEDPKSPFGSAGNTIPALQERGVVFMACHNAIWELAEKLRAKDVNPDGLSNEALAAELTNHLVDGVLLTPGIVATLVELQEAGFRYAS